MEQSVLVTTMPAPQQQQCNFQIFAKRGAQYLGRNVGLLVIFAMLVLVNQAHAQLRPAAVGGGSVTGTAAAPAFSTGSTSFVVFRIDFTKAVSGVSAGNFSLSSTGALSNVGIVSVNQGGTYVQVTVSYPNAASSPGTITLTMVNFSGVSPAVTNLPIASTANYYGIPSVSSGTVSSLNAPVAGVASPATTVLVSGTNIPSGIYVQAPYGFEVSADNTNFGATAVVGGSGATIQPTPVYLRLAVSDPTGNYAGLLIVAAGNASVNVTVPVSTVGAIMYSSGTFSAMSTTTGTASASSTLNVSGINMQSGISLTPSPGFEVSTDNVNFGSTATVPGSGTIASTPIYVRLAAADAPNTYTGFLTLTSTNASMENLYIPNSTVSALPTMVTSITPVSASPTNATTVDYTVTFASALTTSPSTGDFGLTGGVTGSISAVTTSDNTTYDIQVTNVSGNGSLALNMTSAADVSPGISNLPFNGGAYTIDQTAPTASSLTFSSSNSNPQTAQNGNVITLDFTTSEAIAAPTVTIAGHSVTASEPNANHWVATYIMSSGDAFGRVPFTLSISDLASNQTNYSDVTQGDVIEFGLANNNLKSVKTSAGLAKGATVPVTLTETVTNPTSSITVTPTVADATATVTVNNVAVTSGSPSAPIALNTGSNAITIIVTAQNTTTKTYTLTVTRATSANDKLASLVLSAGTLSPAFGTATRYTAGIAVNTSLTVTPTLADTTATLTINGVAATSGIATAVATTAGVNTITIVVTAQNNATKTYTLTVTQAKSSNNTLAALSLNPGTLSPAFGTATNYTASIAAGTTLTVTPTVADPTAMLTINGTSAPSGTATAVTTVAGVNTVTIVVTAQNGAKKTYKLTVTQAISTNDNLASLALSAGTLSPALGTAVNYTATIGNVSQFTITPTLADATASFTINGTAAVSGMATPVPLSPGNNTVAIVVTAQDGVSTRTYTLVVNEARSSNNALFSIKTNAGLAIGKTVPATLTENVANGTTGIRVTPTVDDTTATVTVNGVAVASGAQSASVPLAVGDNIITTVVTAQNGAGRTYTLTVTRAPAALNTVYQPVGVQNVEPLTFQDGINVHQGLSPNGDGINDFLQIDNISQYPDNAISIINRNGQLVFEEKGYDNSTKIFDGHSNKTGQMQLPGTYFYSLDYTVAGVVKHKTGFIVLKY